MSKLKVASFSISIDGFGAGPEQSLENPLGFGGAQLHTWVFPTRTFRREVLHAEGGTTGLDDDFASRGFENLGAWILGRNMFGPVRGDWDRDWNGWWGDDPPFGTPVFVMTHHARAPIHFANGTSFHFVAGPPADVLAQARQSANGLDVRLGGGPSTVRQFLEADLVDVMHLVTVPVVLGAGVRLWDGLAGLHERFDIEFVASASGVVHQLWNRRGS